MFFCLYRALVLPTSGADDSSSVVAGTALLVRQRSAGRQVPARALRVPSFEEVEGR